MAKAPKYKVYIDNDEKRDITEVIESFRYEDSMKEDNLFKITVYKRYAEDLADDEDIITGAILAFQFGYSAGEMSQLHRARITDIDPTYADRITLSVTCLDLGTKVKKVTGGKIWENKTSTQIAQEIATKYNLELEADGTTKVWESIPQGNQSDLDFLKYLAVREANGNYQVYIRNTTLYFVNRGTDLGSLLTLTYGDGDSGIIRFKPKMKESSQTPESNKTTISYVDALEAKVKESEVDSSNEADTGTLGTVKRLYDENGVEITGEDNEVKKKVVMPVQDEEEATNLANSMKKKGTLASMTADLVIEGKPLLTPNNVITIQGVAKRYAGNWFIEKVTHSISQSGYTSSLKLTKNGMNRKLTQNGVDATDVNDSKGSEEGINKEVKLRVFNGNGDFQGYSSSDRNASKSS